VSWWFFPVLWSGHFWVDEVCIVISWWVADKGFPSFSVVSLHAASAAVSIGFIAWDFMDVSISEGHGVALQWLDHIWQEQRHIVWRWF
jgi:hypothetical protein